MSGFKLNVLFGTGLTPTGGSGGGADFSDVNEPIIFTVDPTIEAAVIKTADQTTVSSNELQIRTGNSTFDETGSILITTGTPPVDTDSGSIEVQTSNTTGTGSSGGITLAAGAPDDGVGGNIQLNLLAPTGSGTRGTINFLNGSEGTIGDVWTSIDVDGGGTWATGSSNILAFTSAATIGGAVQETVAVTGLLTSDTVLAVTQKTMGGATRTSLPLIQWNVGSNGNITLDWVADPGVGAVVVVSVKR